MGEVLFSFIKRDREEGGGVGGGGVGEDEGRGGGEGVDREGVEHDSGGGGREERVKKMSVFGCYFRFSRFDFEPSFLSSLFFSCFFFEEEGERREKRGKGEGVREEELNGKGCRRRKFQGISKKKSPKPEI